MCGLPLFEVVEEQADVGDVGKLLPVHLVHVGCLLSGEVGESRPWLEES